jgi:hypothetical protein
MALCDRVVFRSFLKVGGKFGSAGRLYRKPRFTGSARKLGLGPRLLLFTTALVVVSVPIMLGQMQTFAEQDDSGVTLSTALEEHWVSNSKRPKAR